MFYVDRAQVLVDGCLPAGSEQSVVPALAPAEEASRLREFLIRRLPVPGGVGPPLDEACAEVA